MGGRIVRLYGLNRMSRDVRNVPEIFLLESRSNMFRSCLTLVARPELLLLALSSSLPMCVKSYLVYRFYTSVGKPCLRNPVDKYHYPDFLLTGTNISLHKAVEIMNMTFPYKTNVIP